MKVPKKIARFNTDTQALEFGWLFLLLWPRGEIEQCSEESKSDMALGRATQRKPSRSYLDRKFLAIQWPRDGLCPLSKACGTYIHTKY